MGLFTHQLFLIILPINILAPVVLAYCKGNCGRSSYVLGIDSVLYWVFLPQRNTTNLDRAFEDEVHIQNDESEGLAGNFSSP
jgi:hypothetical protein